MWTISTSKPALLIMSESLLFTSDLILRNNILIYISLRLISIDFRLQNYPLCPNFTLSNMAAICTLAFTDNSFVRKLLKLTTKATLLMPQDFNQIHHHSTHPRSKKSPLKASFNAKFRNIHFKDKSLLNLSIFLRL